MIEVSSYFFQKQDYILCEDCNEKITGEIDSEYRDIEGLIELSINGVTLIDKTMGDFIDSLWKKFLWGMADLLIGKNHVFHFPDQPIEIRLTDYKNSLVEVRITVEKAQSAVVDKVAFIEAMSAEAVNFFENMKRLLPKGTDDRDGNYEYWIQLALAIQKKDIDYIKSQGVE